MFLGRNWTHFLSIWKSEGKSFYLSSGILPVSLLTFFRAADRDAEVLRGAFWNVAHLLKKFVIVPAPSRIPARMPQCRAQNRIPAKARLSR